MTLIRHPVTILNQAYRCRLPTQLQFSFNKRILSTSTARMGISNYSDHDGEFRRKNSQFRNFIEKGGQYPPEKGRYHLYVSWACPWGTALLSMLLLTNSL